MAFFALGSSARDQQLHTLHYRFNARDLQSQPQGAASQAWKLNQSTAQEPYLPRYDAFNSSAVPAQNVHYQSTAQKGIPVFRYQYGHPVLVDGFSRADAHSLRGADYMHAAPPYHPANEYYRLGHLHQHPHPQFYGDAYYHDNLCGSGDYAMFSYGEYFHGGRGRGTANNKKSQYYSPATSFQANPYTRDGNTSSTPPATQRSEPDKKAATDQSQVPPMSTGILLSLSKLCGTEAVQKFNNQPLFKPEICSSYSYLDAQTIRARSPQLTSNEMSSVAHVGAPKYVTNAAAQLYEQSDVAEHSEHYPIGFQSHNRHYSRDVFAADRFGDDADDGAPFLHSFRNSSPLHHTSITKQVTESEGKVRWLYKVNDTWEKMEPHVAEQIEKAYQKGHAVSGNYQAANKNFYFVDFHTFEQIDMNNPSNRTPVRREPISDSSENFEMSVNPNLLLK